MYPEENTVVRLTNTSIISLDISGQLVFSLIRHPKFTLDKCIIAFFDVA